MVEVNQHITPFTFFNILFTGKEILNEEAMETLIVHEQYHKDQWHSVDAVLLEIVTVFFWFNPAVWLFRKEIRTEHEYMADNQVLNRGYDSLEYQQLLFQTTTGISLKLGNHFSEKTNLKKRIMMMNQTKMKTRKSYVRALLFVPIMCSVLVVSAFTEANHNLSNELQLLKQHSVQDTVPSKTKVKDEQYQKKVREAVEGIKRIQPLFILKEYGKKKRVIPYSYMEKLDMVNIESIDVLKDKAAIKAYGEKGKNGVVVIKMKKKKDKLK